MVRTIKLKVTVEAEKLLNRMGEKGLKEESAIAKAMWLLDQADKGNLALIDKKGSVIDKIRIIG